MQFLIISVAASTSSSNYTLSLPTTLRGYERAAALSQPKRHTTPARGNILTLLDLADPVGVPMDVFWDMFTICKGCDYIMVGGQLDAHICDLTNC
jgi:hypothetical protein